MLSNGAVEENIVIKDLSKIAAQASKDLEIAKRDLAEKELELKETSEILNQKILAATRVNKDLQNKTQMLLEFSNTLQIQNDELQQKNKELSIKERTYNNLNDELRSELDKVTKKEKELEIRKQYLESQITEKTSDLIKSERMATIGELTSRLAHDLRNPLTVLKSTHAIIKEKPNMKIDERLKYTARIDRALLRIMHLVDDVLDFVRISDIDLQKVSLLSILDLSIDTIDVPKNIKIIKPKYDIEILCDQRKLEAVFSNLITNSIQAINDEDGLIDIRFTTKEKDVVIQIEDSGPGMSNSILDKIYEPLFTTKTHGTGLGLAICKTIVEQHGGTISAKSNPTTFTLTIPKNTE